MQKMELSLVLWNCKGKKGSVPERNAVFRSTYNSWKQKNEIPTVVLAQELYSGGLRSTWRELSKKKNDLSKCETACVFLMGLGQEIELLDSAQLLTTMGPISPSNKKKDGGIHCVIVTLGAEKILICSWHGQYTVKDDEKKDLLKKMLKFVDKVKNAKGCVAALVGGDFNLDKGQVCQSVLQSMSAHLYGAYTSPTFRPCMKCNIIDYVIAWPKDRFTIRKCCEIETHPKEEVNANPRMFDHALIRYDFIVNLKGEWEGEGLVKWGGKCSEGKVTLTGDYLGEYFDVKVTGVEGTWKGKGAGFCKRFERLQIAGVDSFSVHDGKWLNYEKGAKPIFDAKRWKKINWQGNCQVEWKGADAEVNCECWGRKNVEQTVTWNGTGWVEWRGKGKATWVGGKLEKWEGSQTVTCADDRPVRWDGDGEVQLQGDELKHNGQGTLRLQQFGVERVHYNLVKNNILEWSGRGVVWNVTGTGAGTMFD